MEEIKAFSFFLAFDHHLGEFIIFLHNLRNIFLPDRIRITFISNNRFNRHLFESEVCKMHDIIGEIQIISCKCTTNVIFFLISAFCKFLELRNDQIITSFSISKRTHLIIDLFTSIQAQHYIVHFFIYKFLNFII